MLDSIGSRMKINFTYPIYPELTELSKDKRAQACWTFYTLAESLRQKLGNSTEDQFGLLESELWMDPHYVQIASSVALRYQLDSPDEFAKAWPDVRRQAKVLGYPAPHDVYVRLSPRRIII